MPRFSFSSSSQAGRLVNDSQFPLNHYTDSRGRRVMTYSFWGWANRRQGTAEGSNGGYQETDRDNIIGNGPKVRYLLPVPRDIRTTTREHFSNISKFIDLDFKWVKDTGYEFNANWRQRERGRIRIMVDGNGGGGGSSHGAGSDAMSGGETFFKIWPRRTRSTVGVERNRSWTSGGVTNVSSDNYTSEAVLHELHHSLGLGHGHDMGTRNTEHSSASDNIWNTVQSYNGPFGWSDVGATTIVATSMPDDIKALQTIYGARNFNNSNTVYNFKRGDLYSSSSGEQLLDRRFVDQQIDNINTLDDSGGYDIIDCSDYGKAFTYDGVRIDIRAGGYVINQSDWRNGASYTDNNGSQTGDEITGVPRKGTRLSWRTNIEAVQGTERGNDTIIGNHLDNWIAGYGGNDYFWGAAGNDVLIGGSGRDQFFGGLGADRIYLGRGHGSQDNDRDRVDYVSANDSLAHRGGYDVVHGFSSNDLFDLNAIDGNIGERGRQSLRFIGTQSYTGQAGDLRVSGAWGVGTCGFIEADVNGDRRTDFRVALAGESVLATSLTGDNFVLI